MEHNQETSIEPINTSLNPFGVQYENNLVVLDDGKHVVGVHSGDGNYLILENVENGSTVHFGERFNSGNLITTLLYDGKTAFLYAGDTSGRVLQYKVDTTNKTCTKVKDFGKLGIDQITSSHRFLDFVFFGGNQGKIRVLDMSTGELVPGHQNTSMSFIYSLQLCVKSNNQIRLAVSGCNIGFFGNNIDLLDLTNLFPNNFIIQKNFAQENSNNKEENTLPHPSTVKSQEETIKKLLEERDSYKAKYNEMTSKYKDLKEKHDQLSKKNTPEAKYDQKSEMTTIETKKPIIDNCLFDKTDPLVTTQGQKEDIQEMKNVSEQGKNTTYDKLHLSTPAEDESQNLKMIVDAPERKRLQMEEIVEKR